MTKFEIKTDSFQFRMGREKWRIPAMSDQEILDTYFSCDTSITSNSVDPITRERFYSESEAREFFDVKYNGYGLTVLERGNGEHILRGQLAWLEENEYDDDGDWISGGIVLALDAEAYRPEVAEDAED